MTIEKERIRELAGMRDPGSRVLSLYMDLDPRELPTARDKTAALDSLLKEARRMAREDSSLAALPSEARKQLDADIDEVRRYLKDDFSAKGVRSVVVFANGSRGLFEVISLTVPVESEVAVDDAPHIEPLLRAEAVDESYSVVVLSRKLARFFEGTPWRLQEVSDAFSGVVREAAERRDRFQRGFYRKAAERLPDQAALESVRGVSDELLGRIRAGKVDRLILGVPEDLYNRMRDQLHPYVRDRIAGRVDVDERASVAQVEKTVARAVAADQARRERKWIERVKDGMGKGHAVSGLEGALEALNDRRVEALVIETGYRAPGAVSATGYVATSPGVLAADGTKLEARDNVIEPAIELAVQQNAEVVFVHHEPGEISDIGPVAAVVRF